MRNSVVFPVFACCKYVCKLTWLIIVRRLSTISNEAAPTHPIQLGCTTRSTSSERQMSGPAGSAGTCPPPATRSNWPGCWTERRPWLTCRTSVVDTIKAMSRHSNNTVFVWMVGGRRLSFIGYRWSKYSKNGCQKFKTIITFINYTSLWFTIHSWIQLANFLFWDLLDLFICKTHWTKMWVSNRLCLLYSIDDSFRQRFQGPRIQILYLKIFSRHEIECVINQIIKFKVPQLIKIHSSVARQHRKNVLKCLPLFYEMLNLNALCHSHGTTKPRVLSVPKSVANAASRGSSFEIKLRICSFRFLCFLF